MRFFCFEQLSTVIPIKLCCVVVFAISALGTWDSARASSDSASGQNAARRKNPGDLSYRTVWRMQKRVEAMLPKDARLIRPSLRLSVTGMDELERTEFLPAGWAVAIVGKTVDTVVPMRRGGYFSVPQLPQAQARGEDAIVMFNAQMRKNWLDVGWQVNVPASGRLAYREFGQALDELKSAQDGVPWWDIVARTEKHARFNAMRVCFAGEQGRILVGGLPAGVKLGPHCSLLAFDARQLGNDSAIDFVGELELVTLDNSDNYTPDASATTTAVGG